MARHSDDLKRCRRPTLARPNRKHLRQLEHRQRQPPLTDLERSSQVMVPAESFLSLAKDPVGHL